MFRFVTRLALCLTLATPATAQDQTGPDLATAGISARITYLEQDPKAHAFELGMMRGLQGLEHLMQVQARYGIGQELRVLGFRALRGDGARIEDAPATIWRDAYTALAADMERARAALDAASPRPFVLDLSDVWLDVNASGTRDEGEGAADILGPLLFTRSQLRDMEALPSVEVRFDAADADWLAAYTHVFSAFANFALAFDPTEVVEDLRAQRDIMRAAAPIEYTFDAAAIRAEVATLEAELAAAENTLSDLDRSDPDYFSLRRQSRAIKREIEMAELKLLGTDLHRAPLQDQGQSFRPVANAIYVILTALEQEPDRDRIQAVRAHMLEMIQHNRAFWALLAEETDNDREWIPNPSQDAALGIELPPETGPTWLAVLQDAEDVIEGRLLVRHPLLPPGTGINVARYFEDPRDLDLLDWLHGIAAYRYAATGPMITEQRWSQFSRLMNGRGGLFAVFLN